MIESETGPKDLNELLYDSLDKKGLDKEITKLRSELEEATQLAKSYIHNEGPKSLAKEIDTINKYLLLANTIRIIRENSDTQTSTNPEPKSEPTPDTTTINDTRPSSSLIAGLLPEHTITNPDKKTIEPKPAEPQKSQTNEGISASPTESSPANSVDIAGQENTPHQDPKPAATPGNNVDTPHDEKPLIGPREISDAELAQIFMTSFKEDHAKKDGDDPRLPDISEPEEIVDAIAKSATEYYPHYRVREDNIPNGRLVDLPYFGGELGVHLYGQGKYDLAARCFHYAFNSTEHDVTTGQFGEIDESMYGVNWLNSVTQFMRVSPQEGESYLRSRKSLLGFINESLHETKRHFARSSHREEPNVKSYVHLLTRKLALGERLARIFFTAPQPAELSKNTLVNSLMLTSIEKYDIDNPERYNNVKQAADTFYSSYLEAENVKQYEKQEDVTFFAAQLGASLSEQKKFDLAAHCYLFAYAETPEPADDLTSNKAIYAHEWINCIVNLITANKEDGVTYLRQHKALFELASQDMEIGREQWAQQDINETPDRDYIVNEVLDPTRNNAAVLKQVYFPEPEEQKKKIDILQTLKNIFRKLLRIK